MTDQKVILITGTSTGIGRIAAEKFAELGHRVYASMRGAQDKNAEAAKALALTSPQISVVDIDVTKEETVAEGVARIVAEAGRIDVLINNAGIMNIGLTEPFSMGQLHQQMDVNYFGVARMFKAVLPHMRRRRHGLVVTITSLAGRLVFPAFTSYNSSKFAAEALAEGYRYELSPYGVDSVILEPGPFKTDLVDNRHLPADGAVLGEYGEFGDMPNQVIAGFGAFMEEHKAGDCDPQVVVDDLVRLVDAPFGERPLRTVSGLDYGLRGLNEVYAEYQHKVLEAMEMTHLEPKPANVS